MDELIHSFDLSRCSKSGAKFDYEKGKWFNHHYIQLWTIRKQPPSLCRSSKATV